ncbi:MAG TPA: VWA domain-containing protein [Chloroflexus aurantiacus]|jgi:Mg-chelatase subunit ChlD|uniref:von Willebrand factor type A n=2 Tax=Chloroflexus TaxID=1107 RepID=A9WIT9_CHLAA|nr:VWA domain-containing protein [Chloroflexus aurantiacus]ABY35816.1 von Willebrand factor type A [Chloroflexus aurantiacus J-10-fl]RMG51719.1 MAG: VWA domain-containing protein [Chloroflexota bacterium]HBW69319.1 VWA domain-containing protein [Chloroflexus aurantiacus]
MVLSVVEPAALWLFVLAIPLLGLIWLGRTDLHRRLGRVRLWLLVVVRCLILAALVLAVAGLQIGRPVNATATVFLLDVSDSVSPAQRVATFDFIEQAVATADPDDRMAVIVFGARAMVERVAEPPRPLNRIDALVAGSRTNIEDAIQLGLAILPDAMHRRLVLISDGGENAGQALTAARLAAARGVPIEVVILSAERGPDALITALQAPTTADINQNIPLTVQIESEVEGAATVQLIADGQLLAEQSVTVTPGRNQIAFSVPARESGFRRFEARLIAPFDTQPANNRAVAFTFVSGPPRVLLLTVGPEQALALAEAWRAGGIEVTVQTPMQAPANPLDLRSFDAIALVDTPANAVSLALQRTLTTYVRDLGGGLLFIGGPQSFGAGGWRRSLLESLFPVSLDPPSREERFDLALTLVIDRSGSMSELVDGLRTQLDLAREAAFQASLGLSRQDQLSIIAFDSVADVILPLQPLPDLATIEDALSRLSAGGGTNIRSGMALAAETIATADARIRHVILLTDGVSETEYADLVANLRAQGVTVSTVAIGLNTDPELERVAQIGGGKYYVVRQAEALPQILLEETVRVANRDLVEEPFTPALALPTPWLRNFSALPPLQGRNVVAERSISRVLLVADDGSPLLATAQIGVGRVLAWASDMTGHWATAWLSWSAFPRFAAGLVSEVLPLNSDDYLSLSATVTADRVEIDLQARDRSGLPVELGEIRSRISGLADEVVPDFVQIAPGRYRAITTIDQMGAYLVQVSATDRNGMPLGTVATGLTVNYSPEYGQFAANPGLMTELAALTGGQVNPPPDLIFAPTERSVYEVWPVTMPLIWLALALLPVDIALRRLFVAVPDWRPVVIRRPQRKPPEAKPSSSAPAPTSTLPQSDEERIAALLAAKRRRRRDE